MRREKSACKPDTQPGPGVGKSYASRSRFSIHFSPFVFFTVNIFLQDTLPQPLPCIGYFLKFPDLWHTEALCIFVPRAFWYEVDRDCDVTRNQGDWGEGEWWPWGSVTPAEGLGQSCSKCHLSPWGSCVITSCDKVSFGSDSPGVTSQIGQPFWAQRGCCPKRPVLDLGLKPSVLCHSLCKPRVAGALKQLNLKSLRMSVLKTENIPITEESSLGQHCP